MKNIIIIDMQKGFINNNNNFLVDRINNYLTTQQFDNVIYTKFVNDENSPFVKILNYNSLMSADDQSIVVKQINGTNATLVLEKYGYGLTPLMIEKIKKLGISEIELCGTDTDACVMAIAYNLFDNNIKPIILSELCGSSSKNKAIHFNSIEIMARSFGKENIK